MRAVLIDDEISGLKSLQLIIEKYCPQIKIVAATKEAIKGVELINDYHPDIVFLDINMPKLNGFEVLEKLTFRNFQLVFTTAHEEYALKAIKQSAVDYLLKPITGNDLRSAITKVEERVSGKKFLPDVSKILKELSKETQQRISINTKNSIEIVSANEIIYIESFLGGANVVLEDSIHKTTKPLKEFEDMLCSDRKNFIRIQNSFIVNIDFIKNYFKEDGGFIIMSDDRKITISRDRKADFLKLISKDQVK